MPQGCGHCWDIMTDIVAFPLLAEADRLAATGQLEQAAGLVMQHLRERPKEPRGLAALGKIASRLGALNQAEAFLKSALAQGAAGPDVLRDLASVLNQQEKPIETLKLLDHLQRLAPDTKVQALRAVVLDKLGRHDDALAERHALVLAEPGNPFFWVFYGHSLRSQGRVPDAVEAYRQATTLDFECGEAWWGLASIKSRILTDADIVEMERALKIAIDIRNSAPLHFALGRAWHDRAQYERAFSHYALGNQQRADSIGYRREELTEEVDELIAKVEPSLFASWPAAAPDVATPIFVVSLPRSGSTLLEQMLACHPQIEAAGELPYIPALLRSEMEEQTRRQKTSVVDLVLGMDAARAQALGAEYLRRSAHHRPGGKPFFVDKLPHNWSNILFIRRILPKARFLLIQRNPLDCCFSNFTQSFSVAHASSFNLADIGQCYVDHVRATQHLSTLPDVPLHTIIYEDLVQEPEHQLRPMLDFLGLEWDPAVLEFYKLDRVVRTPSSEQVRRPLNDQGMGIWHAYAKWLGPLREALGPLAADA